MPALERAACEAALDAGIDVVAITDAAPFHEARATIESRRAAGLHGGMAFTYRNPARSTDPARTVSGAQSLVVGAVRYRRAGDADPPPSLRAPAAVARYARSDHYAPLRHALQAAAAVLTDAGHRAVALVDDNALVDRAAAVRAGLGWSGKNTNVLLPGRGSWYVLGSVVTDAALETTAPRSNRGPEPTVPPEGCGTCTKCIPACPTDAFTAPGVLDARRCLAWLLQQSGVFPREHREALGARIYGCDACQEPCPPNRTADRHDPPGATDDDGWIDAVELALASDAEILARYGRWYIPKRDPSAVRRNAFVVIGNTASNTDALTITAVRSGLAHPDPIVRAHAVWAAARLGRRDLLEGVEPHPVVDAEMADLPPARGA